MAAELLPDGLWELLEPFIPAATAKRKGGRPRLSNRVCLLGILFSFAQWDSLGNAAAGTGLRFRHDLLAAIT